MPKKSETKTKDTKAKSTTDKSSTKPLGIKPEEFKLSRLFLKPIDEKFSSGGSQLNAFPKYDADGKEDKLRTERRGDNFIVFTDPIKLTRGGVPKIDGKYKKTDADREYFWLPWDTAQKSSDNCFKMLTQIDDEYDRLINEEGNKDTVVKENEKGDPKPIKGIYYDRIVKEASGPDDDSDSDSDGDSDSDDSDSKNKKSKKNAKDSDKKKFVPYKRFKVRFSTKYDKDRAQTDPKEIDTLLFRGSNAEPENLKTVSDFEREMPWNSTVVLVLMFNKFWVQKSATGKGKDKKKSCSFSVKVLQIVVTEKPESQGKQAVTQLFRNNIYASQGAKPEQVEKSDESDKDSDKDSDKESDKESDKDSDADDAKASDDDDESGESDEEPVKETKKGSDKKPKETVKEASDKEESDKDDSDKESDKDNSDPESDKESVKETKPDKKKVVEKPAEKKETKKEVKKDSKKAKKEDSESDASDHDDSDKESDKDDSDDEPQEKKKVSAKSTKKGKKEETKPKSKKSTK
jgi:hypothetical protein